MRVRVPPRPPLHKSLQSSDLCGYTAALILSSVEWTSDRKSIRETFRLHDLRGAVLGIALDF